MNVAWAAKQLGGRVWQGKVSAPGPGRSRSNNSLLVTFDPNAPDGFWTYSFRGDDPRVCRDHVKARLGSSIIASAPRPVAKPIGEIDRAAYARKLWRHGIDPRGTLAERYLLGVERRLSLPDEIASRVVRFNPSVWFAPDVWKPAMLTLFRDVRTDKASGIQTTFLSPDGKKVERRTMGPVQGCAIKLAPDKNVTDGLCVAEGFETALSAYLGGFRPTWALGSADAIGLLEPLSGIESVSICAEHNDHGANARAIAKCAPRWHAAGREVFRIDPLKGDDLNDAWREAV